MWSNKRRRHLLRRLRIARNVSSGYCSTSRVRVARGCQSKATKSKCTQTTLPVYPISAIFYTSRSQTYSFPTFPCVTELHRLQDVSYLFIRCHTMALEQVDVITGTQRVELRYSTINHSARFFQVRYCNLSPLTVLLCSSYLYFPPILQIPPLARHPFTANHPHICVSLIHYILAVLAILPHTYILNLALVSVILSWAWNCAIGLDFSVGLAKS